MGAGDRTCGSVFCTRYDLLAQGLFPHSNNWLILRKGFLEDFPNGLGLKDLPANAGIYYVISLVWEDPTCHGATKSVHHSY